MLDQPFRKAWRRKAGTGEYPRRGRQTVRFAWTQQRLDVGLGDQLELTLGAGLSGFCRAGDQVERVDPALRPVPAVCRADGLLAERFSGQRHAIVSRCGALGEAEIDFFRIEV